MLGAISLVGFSFMIIVTTPDSTEEQIQHIIDRIREWGLKAEVSRGAIREPATGSPR